MNHPNALAALATSTIVLGGEQMLETYSSTHLGPFWSKALVGAVTTVVLYIGRKGIKGSLATLFGTIKAIWSGPAGAPPETPAAAAASAKEAAAK